MALERPLAIVQGRIITTGEFESWCKEVMGDIPWPKEREERINTMRSLLKALVERKMMLFEAEEEGIKPPKLPGDAPKSVENDLIIAKLISKKLSGITVSDDEITKRYRKMYPRRKKSRLVLFSSIKFYDLGEARKALYKLRRLPKRRRIRAFNEYKKKKEEGELYLDELNHRYFSQDELPDEFTPVFRARKGEVVGPVVTDDGIFLLLIEDVKLKSPPPLAKVKENIRGIILSEKKEEAFMNFINELYKKYSPIINYKLLDQYSTLDRNSPEGGAR